MPEPRFDARLDFNERQRDALRAVDRIASDGEIREEGVLRLDEAVRSDRTGDQSAYIAAASSPEYRIAFTKVLEYGDNAAVMLTDVEREAVHRAMGAQRALALSGTAAYPVPIQLDPTVIPTSSGAYNPLRQIARVETATSNVWKGVTSSRRHGRIRTRRHRGNRQRANARTADHQSREGELLRAVHDRGRPGLGRAAAGDDPHVLRRARICSRARSSSPGSATARPNRKACSSAAPPS